MKLHVLFFVLISFVVTSLSAQVFWTEDFGVGCNQNNNANGFATSNGAWGVTVTGANDALGNLFFISATEAGMGAGNCGDGCLGSGGNNRTLHIGNVAGSPASFFCPSGDCGAAYDATVTTNLRAESPTINCTGQNTITLSFDYMVQGEVGLDECYLWYFDGATWSPLGVTVPQTQCCNGAACGLFTQGEWAAVPLSIALPASADNNANVRVGFEWTNDNNNSGTDPSITIDNITLSTPITTTLTSSFSSSDSTLCEGDCIDFTDLSAGSPTGWSWQFFGAATSSSSAQNPTNICYNTAGSYDVSLTVTDGTNTDSLFMPNFIVVTIADTASFSYSSGSYCLVDPNPTPTISATIGGSFSIDNGGSINSSTGEIDIAASGVGAYVVTYLTNGACPDTTTFNVSIVNSADATITHVGPFCFNEPSFNLTAAGAGGNWTGTGITDGTNGTFDAATAGVGNHLITYTISGSCGDVDTMTITINAADDASFTYANTTFCDTDTDPIPTSITTTGGSFAIDNSGIINNSTGEVDLSASGAGSYIITYTTNGTCPNFDTLTMTIVNCSVPPVADLSANNNSVCINDCINFFDISSGGTPTSWNWYFEGGNPSTSSQQNPSNICYDTIGNYGVSLVVTNAFGSDSTYRSNFITVDSCNIQVGEIIIPNVFSPNGDGENELFKPYGGIITSLYMEIYNRWGELIYKTDQVNSGWDGRTTAGALCSEGTYFYIIEVNTETYKGSLTMLR